LNEYITVVRSKLLNLVLDILLGGIEGGLLFDFVALDLEDDDDGDD
jgi:hypothetical protein